MEQAPPDLLGYVSGHPVKGECENDRLSWVPLPSTGHHYVDGRIRRVAVLGPRGGDQNLFRRAVFGGQFATLKKDGQECALMVETDTVEGAISSYVATSREWWTVTPVVLPGHTTKGRRQPGRLDPNKIGALVGKALAREGYPEPEEVFVQNAPFLHGGLSAAEYRVANYMVHTRLHIRVQFPHPVTGPVVAGVGRHYGLGLFAAVDMPSSR
jgi:CRISPR-associated protein Csb2